MLATVGPKTRDVKSRTVANVPRDPLDAIGQIRPTRTPKGLALELDNPFLPGCS
jgi:hypothetical protein